MEHAIRAEGLVKQFGSVQALAGVDLAVPPGTVLGLLGPNGAGKTTAVRILTTILHPDNGVATVLGLDVTKHPAEVRQSIGLAGQYAAVDENLTGRENLRLVGKLTRQSKKSIGPRADELLAQFDLVDAGDRTVKTYSGGMRRRLDVAAALVHRPPVLFLDEPTTGLDPRSRNDLWRTLEDLVAGGTTVLLTTQYLEEADRLADRIAVVDHGRVIAEGTAAELKSRLGTTILSVGLAPGAAVDEIKSLLGEVGATDVTDDGRTIEVTIVDSGPAVLQAVRLLDGAGAPVDSIAVREPSLDDVFLQLTGRPATDGNEDGDAAVKEARA